MKTFLFIFIFALSLKADTVYLGKCVNTFSLYQNTRIYFTYSDNTLLQNIAYSSSVFSEFVNNNHKFEYDSNTGRCNPIPKNNTLGLTNEQYNFMMALTGLLSSILLVSIIFKKV